MPDCERPGDCAFPGCDCEDDDSDPFEEIPRDECGRWENGKLTKRCSKAGSEECDFECPYRNAP